LTLKLAVEKACAAELTDRETSALHGESMNRVETALPECFRCGKKNHVPNKWLFFRKSKCHGCQNYGHIIKKCPNRSDNNNSKKTRFGKSKGKDDKRKINKSELIALRQIATLKATAKAKRRL
jgi:predicted ATP-dependent serine protease